MEPGGKIADDALPDVAVLVSVAGAGAVLASVLVASGVGGALADPAHRGPVHPIGWGTPPG
ncbi:hypothetical protein [Propionibacterium sp.]|uniref:GntT/GntP/DsdX family permease n=1 Tax=Propionibacterium sp. TaxID=1977903 RepID=UPI0039EABD41